ncbi:MAG: hypothetical protein H7A51_17100 [Akkermansiaceae bacterium]|nr:hypothetical protein [Akkermansiaceae bacterium]
MIAFRPAMPRFSILLLLSLLPGLCMAENDLSQASTDDLEDRLEKIETELDGLARFTLRSGVGNIGWFSEIQKNPRRPEWAEIRFSESRQFDQIVLVPVLWIDAGKGPQADGFPTAFKIIAGADGDTGGRVIAEMGPGDPFLPRIAPLVIDVPPTSASWVRIVATQLSAHSRNGNRIFKLSEIMLFSGQHNVALHQPVRVSSNVGGWGEAAIYKKALVDGLTPFLMDAATEEMGNAFVTSSNRDVPFTLTVDLGNNQPIDGIRFHSALIDEYVPQINSSDFGMPRQFTVKGAKRADFSDAVTLLEYRRDSVYQAGNILEQRFLKTECRYVRLTVPKGGWSLDAKQTRRIISLDEIEVLADGLNVARGRPVHFPRRTSYGRAGNELLTDGRNHFGRILPIREWMGQLARRHDLEIQQPQVASALNLKYAKQKANLRRMSWLVALLAAGIVFVILIDRMLRLRAVLKVRERVAANLHDELSANLHAIVLLGDMAKKHIQSPGKLNEVVDRMQQVSKRSRIAARHCANMLQSDSLCEDLVKEMKFSAERLLSDTSHEISVEGETLLQQLSRRKRNDLFLFYQECLINIARHAEATSCSTRLIATQTEISLTVSDNGLGIKKVPPSLKRRARLLRAHVIVETPETGGTRIILTL